MHSLFKKLDELSDLLKAFGSSISIPKPKMPKPKMPQPPKPGKEGMGISPASKKDPKKIAEQLKNKGSKEQKPKTKPTINFSSNGQWKM